MSGWRLGWAALTSVVVIAAGLAGIGWLSTIAPVQAPPGLISSPPGLPEAPAEPPSQAPSPLPASEKHLTFEFTDHGGQNRTVTCTVQREDFERELDTFGVDPQRFWPSVNAELKAALEAEARERGVAHLFTIDIDREADLSQCCNYTPARNPKLAKLAQGFIHWLNLDGSKVRNELVERAYHRHGFLYDSKRDELSVDYETIIRNATGPLTDCFRKLLEAGAGVEQDRRAGFFVAFFQALPYESPPDPDERGRKTLDFRVPTAVLIEKSGDCDSKVAAFCAMWRQLPARSMIAMDRGRKHILVGVEARPRPGQLYKLIENRYYVFYDAAGPEDADAALPGYFEHLVIEPAGSG